MGQKINPVIFRLNQTHDWKSKYFEKKSTESAVCNFNDIEIRTFISKFFEYNGLTVHDLKLSYFNNTLHIFASYFPNLKTISLISANKKIKKIRLITKKIGKENYKIHIKNMKNYRGYIVKKYGEEDPRKNILNKYKRYNIKKYGAQKHKSCVQNIERYKRYIQIKKNVTKYGKYEELNYVKNLSKNLKNKFFNEAKVIIKKEKQVLKLRRIRFLKYYKNHLLTERHKDIYNVKINSFLTKFFESLSLFTHNKTNISLTLNKLNSNIKQDITKKKVKILKKNLVKLRRYEQNEFFKEGINTLFLCSTRKNSAKLLSHFIAIQLKKLKRHNFFLRFIKNTLLLFNTMTFSKLEGIKIKIKGRFNKAPRARHKIIAVGNDVPALTLKAKIDYAETTSFAQNGTFGVKVWICEKKN
jgi:ribosomal protein S3